MKTAIFLCLSLLLMGTLPATSAKRYSDDLYRDVISRHCRAVEHDVQKRYFNIPQRISRSSIQIRRVRAISRGWLRITGIGTSNGRTTQGHVDFHPRSGQARCPSGSWIYGPYLPLWPILKGALNIR